MLHHTVLPVLLLAIATPSALGQVSVDGIEFTDLGLSGVIDLGDHRGGLGVIDYDGDGWVDLVIGDHAGQTPRLYRNVPDPDRPGERTFVDVTVGSGFGDPDSLERRATGVLAADYDNDGDTDVYLVGWRPANQTIGLLFRNDGGSFTNVSDSSGVRGVGFIAESASWVDFDLDGDVDLLALGDVGDSGRALLLRNEGDGTFSNANDLLPPIDGTGHCYGHLWTDYDGDGYPDCLALWSGPRLLKNVPDGSGGRRFVDAEEDSGFSVLGPGPMGIAAGDIDGDLDIDIAVSNAGAGVYYENNGGAYDQIFPFESIFAWGISWLDVENDGDLDHFQCGSLGQGPNLDLLFRNLGAGAWDDISPVLNGASAQTRYAVQLDYDNDGRRDLIDVNQDDFISVYRNVTAKSGHWIMVKPSGDGQHVNRDAIGAVVTITVGEAQWIAELRAGSSTTATEDPRLHFGLGADATVVDSIEVLWPRRGSLSSRREVFAGPFAADSIVCIEAGCPADVDRDGAIGFSDLLALLSQWGPCADCPADLDGDGTIGFSDLLIVLAAWGPCA